MILASSNLYYPLKMRALSSNLVVIDVFLLECASRTAKGCSYRSSWAVITAKFCKYFVFIVSLTKVLVIRITFALTNRPFELLCGNRRFYVMNSIKITACFGSDDVPWYILSCSALHYNRKRNHPAWNNIVLIMNVSSYFQIFKIGFPSLLHPKLLIGKFYRENLFGFAINLKKYK
jgi:hypothetical protein